MADLDNLDDRTWRQLAAALRVAVPALEREAESSRDARDAMASIGRILSDDWDGREGAE